MNAPCPEFTTVDHCPSNRERLDTWYRKRLPFLAGHSNAWSHLRARGEAIKRQWRAYWRTRELMKFSNITHFQSRKTP